MMSGRENDRHLRGDWPHFRSFAKQPIITRRANNRKTRNKNNIHGQLSPLQKHGTWKRGSGDDSLKSYTWETIDSRIGINSVLVPFFKIFVIYMLNVKSTHLRKKMMKWWQGKCWKHINLLWLRSASAELHPVLFYNDAPAHQWHIKL